MLVMYSSNIPRNIRDYFLMFLITILSGRQHVSSAHLCVTEEAYFTCMCTSTVAVFLWRDPPSRCNFNVSEHNPTSCFSCKCLQFVSYLNLHYVNG